MITEEYKTCGWGFIESEMTLKPKMWSDIEKFSTGSGVSFFPMGIITDHAERESAAERLFTYWCSAWGWGTAHKKRLSGSEHTAGERQHAALCLSHLSVFMFAWQDSWHIYISCLFTLPLWLQTWGAADCVSLTSCLFFTNPFPFSQSVFLSSSSLISLASLPLCSLFCEPERGGWLGFSPLQTGLCMPVSLPVA